MARGRVIPVQNGELNKHLYIALAGMNKPSVHSSSGPPVFMDFPTPIFIASQASD